MIVVLVVVSLLLGLPGSYQQWQNSYDGVLDITCADNSALNRVASVYEAWAGDRVWQWDCLASAASVDFDDCYWTGYVNWFDAPIYMQCEDNYVFNGVYSYHVNWAEDRQWDVKCCKAPNHFTKNCVVSGYVNSYGGAIDYSVTQPRVFTGMFSAHSNAYEDRIWAFQSCEYTQCTGGLTCESVDDACEHATVIDGTNLVCSCYEGYNLASNLRSCLDIDECTSNNGGCTHTCINSPGSYHCFCDDGHEMANDLSTCIDIDECSYTIHPCQHNCSNTIGSYQCTCDDGYYLADNNVSCIDINECAWQNGNCSQICNNFQGSYNCSCESGYWLGEDEMTCYDIDECVNNIGACEHACANIVGSYICYCNQGYELTNIFCTDINECMINNGGCSHMCANAIGSYMCQCGDGYMLDDGNTNCIDIDECSISNGGCQHNCSNQVGSFTCSCMTGYELSRDQFCSAIIAERSSGSIADSEAKLVIIIPVAIVVGIIFIIIAIVITVLVMKIKIKDAGKAMIYKDHGVRGLYPDRSSDSPPLNRYDPDTVSMSSLKKVLEDKATFDDATENPTYENPSYENPS